MKKTILFIFIVVLFINLKAQDSSEPNSGKGMFIGANFGYGMVTFRSILKDEKHFAGTTYDNFSYGIIAGYKLNGLISFQFEGNYAKYGARNIIPTYIYSPLSPLLTNFSASSAVQRVDMNLYNIDIPLSIRISLGDGNFVPYFYGGCNYGINIKGVASFIHENTVTETVMTWKTTDDITTRIIRGEFAPIAGIGLKYNMFKLSLFGDLRYKHGFTNLSNVDNNFGFKSSAIWVSAGLLLNL